MKHTSSGDKVAVRDVSWPSLDDRVAWLNDPASPFQSNWFRVPLCLRGREGRWTHRREPHGVTCSGLRRLRPLARRWLLYDGFRTDLPSTSRHGGNEGCGGLARPPLAPVFSVEDAVPRLREQAEARIIHADGNADGNPAPMRRAVGLSRHHAPAPEGVMSKSADKPKKQQKKKPQKTLKERRSEKRAAKKFGSGSLLRADE